MTTTRRRTWSVLLAAALVASPALVAVASPAAAAPAGTLTEAGVVAAETTGTFANLGQTAVINGIAQAGRDLTVSWGRWSPEPDDSLTTYAWFRDGTALGVTTAQYRATTADVGRTLTARVTIARAGYTSVTQTTPGRLVRAAGDAGVGDGCVPGPSHPDRGLRPMCDAPAGATVAVQGSGFRPGGKVTVTGAGWTPGQAVSVRYNDQGTLPGVQSGVLASAGLVAGADGTFTGTVTLPSQTDIDWVVRQSATTLTWLRFLASDPARSTHALITFAAGVVDPGLVDLDAAPPQSADPVDSGDLVTAAAGGATLSVAGTSATVVVPNAAPGVWTYLYAYEGVSPRAVGWFRPDASHAVTFPWSTLKLAPGNVKIAALGRSSNLLGWSTLVITKVTTTTKLTVASSASAGARTTATVVVTPSRAEVVPTGKVTVTVGGTKVATATLTATSRGRATIKLPAWAKIGTRKVVARYAGSSAATASTSTTRTVKVVRARATVKLSGATRATTGTRATITVKVAAATGIRPVGKVTIKDGKRTLRTVSLKSSRKGVIKITLPRLSKGTHKITATFRDSATVRTTTSKSRKIVVKKASTSKAAR